MVNLSSVGMRVMVNLHWNFKYVFLGHAGYDKYAGYDTFTLEFERVFGRHAGYDKFTLEF